MHRFFGNRFDVALLVVAGFLSLLVSVRPGPSRVREISERDIVLMRGGDPSFNKTQAIDCGYLNAPTSGVTASLCSLNANVGKDCYSCDLSNTSWALDLANRVQWQFVNVSTLTCGNRSKGTCVNQMCNNMTQEYDGNDVRVVCGTPLPIIYQQSRPPGP